MVTIRSPKSPLVAKPSNAALDGTPRLRFDTPIYWTYEQAATALALVFAGEPLKKGLTAIQAGLNRVVRERLLEDEERAAAVSPVAVEKYVDALKRHHDVLFNDTRVEDDEPLLRREQRTFFTLDDASTALALLVADTDPAEMVAIEALQQAAKERLLEDEDRKKSADQAHTAAFREWLLDGGSFPTIRAPKTTGKGTKRSKT